MQFTQIRLAAALMVLSISLAVDGQDIPKGSLASIKTVYVLPMKDRLEHFLTNELVKWGRFQVTLNPRQADGLLSDTTEVNIKELTTSDAKLRRTAARTRGTAFLIDIKSEQVLWSAAKKPSESFFLGGEKSSSQLAQEIVEQLKNDESRSK
jgi:hypothetical protein